MRDPNPLVNGRGIARLRRNGIDVSVGCLREWAMRLNRHYLKSMTTGVPYIAIRAGMSLDGKLSDKSRRSRWVTSSELRRYSNSLRGEFSAILAGTETVLADNPRLTLRDPLWKGKRFFRVVSIPAIVCRAICTFSGNRTVIRQSSSVRRKRPIRLRKPIVIFSSPRQRRDFRFPMCAGFCSARGSLRSWWKGAGK